MSTRRICLPLLTGLSLLLWISCALAAPTSVDHSLEDSHFPSLESAIRIKGPITFCGEAVPLERPEIRERLEKELLLMLWDRAQLILWLKRSGRYFPFIEKSLYEARMPQDLKYIAVIESALKPEAGSSQGARGVWQFIPSTGRNYGMVIDGSIDERRNFHISTKAALTYFTELHSLFNSWALACAGYNMGEDGLRRRMELQEVSDYYNLDLPDETERYVMRAIAAKLILSDPVRYGFNLIPEDYYEFTPYDRVRFTTASPAPIVVVAKAANTHYKMIKDMNPQLLTDTIPRGEHIIFLPKGASNGFAERYQPLIASYRGSSIGTATYTVRRGDTQTSIAQKLKIPLWKLQKDNNLQNRSTIRPGQKLIVKP